MNPERATGDAPSQDIISEGVISDEEHDYSSINTSSPTFEDFDRWQSHIGLKTFGEGLNAAARAVFPIESRSRYSKVYVLLAYWAEGDANRPAPVEISKLFSVFKDTFHFDTQYFKIPSENTSDIVTERISDFVKLGGDSEDHLKIVFYAGDARVTKNKRLVWIRYARMILGELSRILTYKLQWKKKPEPYTHDRVDRCSKRT